MGVKALAVLSTGKVVPNPKHLSRHARRMDRLQAQCSRRAGPAKGRPPSKRWRRSAARLGRAHAKVTAARTDGLQHCGLVADRDANAAVNLASLVESVTSTGTASGAGTGQGVALANAQGDDKFMPSGRWSSTNCEDGTTVPAEQCHKTVTATRQRVAPKPVLIGSDR